MRIINNGETEVILGIETADSKIILQPGDYFEGDHITFNALYVAAFKNKSNTSLKPIWDVNHRVDLVRFPVPGGWLVSVLGEGNQPVSFYPDPTHSWDWEKEIAMR